MKRHELLETDTEARTGTCRECGPVKINKAGSYKGVCYWKCCRSDDKYLKAGTSRKPNHFLSSIDGEARTATCSLCGPVLVIKSGSYLGKPLWRCRLATSAKKVELSTWRKHKLSEMNLETVSATCASCGPVVPVRAGIRNGIQRWNCPLATKSKPKSQTRPHRHVLSSIDLEAKTAVCKKCGPTGIVSRGTYEGKRYWRCLSAYRWERLSQKYGISEDQYLAMYKKQEGKCFICKKEVSVLCVDHDHSAPFGSNVRGLLCHACNSGLGQFKDDPSILQSAIDYLTLHALLKPAQLPPFLQPDRAV